MVGYDLCSIAIHNYATFCTCIILYYVCIRNTEDSDIEWIIDKSLISTFGLLLTY